MYLTTEMMMMNQKLADKMVKMCFGHLSLTIITLNLVSVESSNCFFCPVRLRCRDATLLSHLNKSIRCYPNS